MRKRIANEVSNAELDKAFRSWMGFSPILEEDGMQNRIGYYTLKSWLSIPPKKRKPESDNEKRYLYAVEKFKSFKKTLREEKMYGAQSSSEIELERAIKQKKLLLSKKNWGLPHKFMESMGVIITKANVTPEEVSLLAEEIKGLFETPGYKKWKKARWWKNLLLTSTKVRLNMGKSILARIPGIGGLLRALPTGELFEKTRQEVIESNPEVRLDKKNSAMKELWSWVVIPGIATTIFRLGFIGLTTIIYQKFISKTIVYEIIKETLGSTSSLAIGIGLSFLIGAIIASQVWKYLWKKKNEERKKEMAFNPEENKILELFDPLAAEIYAGYQTPEKIAEIYQKRLEGILEEYKIVKRRAPNGMVYEKKTPFIKEPETMRRQILSLWQEFLSDVAPSVDKGVYLRGEQEARSRLDYFKRASSEENSKGCEFYFRFRDLVQEIKMEEEIPNILEEFKDDICKDMKDLLEGRAKIPPEVMKYIMLAQQEQIDFLKASI
jgi:hypothetical protein